MSVDTAKLFKSQMAQALNVVTVNYFSGVFAATPKSSLPPNLNVSEVNTLDYRKAFTSNPILFWGEDNKFPDHIEAEAMASSAFEGGYKILCDHMRGQSFSLALPVYKNGQRILEEVNDDEVMDELEEIGYFEYWHDSCGELPKWGNIWPMFYLNDKRDIARIKINDGGWNRFEKPHPKTGKNEGIYTSAQWFNGIDKKLSDGIPKDLKNWIKRYSLLDRYDYVTEMELMKKTNVFASHGKFHTSGTKYGRAPWHSLYLNRYLGISGKVPEMLIRYYEAAMTINYLIYIDNEWLVQKFPDIDKWDEEKRSKKVKELQDSYEKNLRGTGNAFKSLMLSYRMKEGKEVKNVMFETLDNKARNGEFIPHSQMSDGQVLFTLGLDPGLIGVVVPGGKGGESGSGSKVREASLALQMRLRPDREICHNPFYIWRDYKFRNSSDKKKKRLVILTKDYIINTLDGRAPASAQETTPTN